MDAASLEKGTDVPSSPSAELMFYMACIRTVLDIDDLADMPRLSSYHNYKALTTDDVNHLLVLSALLEPRALMGKCLIENDQLCGKLKCKFYQVEDLKSKHETFDFPDSLQIAGQLRKIKKNFVIKNSSWLQQYFTQPFRGLNATVDEKDPEKRLEGLKARRRSRLQSLELVKPELEDIGTADYTQVDYTGSESSKKHVHSASCAIL